MPYLKRLLSFLLLLSVSLSLSHNLTIEKVPNSYRAHVKWIPELCLKAFEETRLYPNPVCFPTIQKFYSICESQREMNITSWAISQNLTVRPLLITGAARSGTTMIAAMTSALGIRLSNDAQAPATMGTVSWSFAAPPSIDPMCPLKNETQKTDNQQRSPSPNLPPSLLNSNNNIHLLKAWIDMNNKKKFEPWGNERKRYRFTSIFHQVRNPLSSIPSLVTEIPHWKRCQSVLSQIVPSMDFSASLEHMALQIWVEWNSRLDQFLYIPVYRVEDFNLIDLLKSMNFNSKITEDDYECAYRKYFGHNSRTNSSLPRQQLSWSNVYAINNTLAMRAMDMAYRYGYRYYRNSTMVKLSPTKANQTVSVTIPPPPIPVPVARQIAEKLPPQPLPLIPKKIKPIPMASPRKYHVFQSTSMICNMILKGTYQPPQPKKPKKRPTIPKLNLTELSPTECSQLFDHPVFVN